jgi:hypothetical protein
VKKRWKRIFWPLYEAVKLCAGASPGTTVNAFITRIGLACIGVHLPDLSVCLDVLGEMLSRALELVIVAGLRDYEFGVCTLHEFGFAPADGLNVGEIRGRRVLYCEA